MDAGLQTEILSQKIAEIRPRFLAELSMRLDLFDALRDQIEAASDARPLLDELMYGAHRIAGLAATLGFGDLGDLSRRAEAAIRDSAATGATRASSEVLNRIDDFLGEMALLLTQH